MPIRWKVEPLPLLKKHGYSSYRIRKENLFPQTAVQSMRKLGHIGFKDLGTICKLTHMQPGKLIEYVPDEDE